MLSQEQKKWISHLGTEKVEIVPYNPEVKRIFKQVEKEIKQVLGDVEIRHCGSTALGISGQGEIDLYIPTSIDSFNRQLKRLTEYFGRPGSIYALRRARFVKRLDGVKIEMFLINKESSDWINCLKFESRLKNNARMLREYEKLKRKSNGLTVREYYRRKLEFINKILKT